MPVTTTYLDGLLARAQIWLPGGYGVQIGRIPRKQIGPYRGFESLPLRQLTIPNVPNLHQSACSATVYGSESFPSIPEVARRNPEKTGYETG